MDLFVLQLDIIVKNCKNNTWQLIVLFYSFLARCCMIQCDLQVPLRSHMTTYLLRALLTAHAHTLTVTNNEISHYTISNSKIESYVWRTTTVSGIIDQNRNVSSNVRHRRLIIFITNPRQLVFILPIYLTLLQIYLNANS